MASPSSARTAAVRTKLRVGDQVRLIAGRDKGKEGRVLSIDSAKGRAVIEGLNMVKKAVRPTQQNQKGGISEVEAPVTLSNVMVVCKRCGMSRIGFVVKGDQKTRVCRKCGEEL